MEVWSYILSRLVSNGSIAVTNSLHIAEYLIRKQDVKDGQVTVIVSTTKYSASTKVYRSFSIKNAVPNTTHPNKIKERY